MSGPLDSLVRIRLLLFEKALADSARVASRVRRAYEILDEKAENQASIERKREEVSNRLHVLQNARWLANLLALDNRLAEDLSQARQEVDLVESDLSVQRNCLSRGKGELAKAQARLLVARNLDRRRRRTVNRLKDRKCPGSGHGVFNIRTTLCGFKTVDQ